MSHSQQAISAAIRTVPANAVARVSIISQRSSRPGPPRPASVSLRWPPIRKISPTATIIPSPAAPVPRSSAATNAPRMSRPRNVLNAGMNHRLRYRLRGSISMEHLLDRQLEVAGQGDRQRQRRRVLLRLDRDDRLPRHPHRQAQLGLAEGPCTSKLPDLVSHDDVKLA